MRFPFTHQSRLPAPATRSLMPSPETSAGKSEILLCSAVILPLLSTSANRSHSSDCHGFWLTSRITAGSPFLMNASMASRSALRLRTARLCCSNTWNVRIALRASSSTCLRACACMDWRTARSVPQVIVAMTKTSDSKNLLRSFICFAYSLCLRRRPYEAFGFLACFRMRLQTWRVQEHASCYQKRYLSLALACLGWDFEAISGHRLRE